MMNPITFKVATAKTPGYVRISGWEFASLDPDWDLAKQQRIINGAIKAELGPGIEIHITKQFKGLEVTLCSAKGTRNVN